MADEFFSHGFWDGNSKTLFSYAYDNIEFNHSDIWKEESRTALGFSGTGAITENITIIGNDDTQRINFNISRKADNNGFHQGITGGVTFSLGGGSDDIGSGKFTNKDSVDMGAGDDIVVLEINGSWDGIHYCFLMVKLVAVQEWICSLLGVTQMVRI